MNLRKMRKERGLSETSISKKVGISQQHYSFIENGKRHPSVEVAKKIAKELEFDWSLLFDDVQEKRDVNLSGGEP